MKKSTIALAILAASTSAYAANIEQGYYLSTKGNAHVVAGNTLETTGESLVNIGRDNKVNGKVTTVIGQQATATSNMSVVIGFQAKSEENMTTAIGSGSNASGNSASAYGKASLAAGKASVAVGSHSTAEGDTSVAVGQHANANGGQSVAIGQSSVAKADQSIAIGSGANAQGRFSTAIGVNAKANNYQDVAIGFGSTTTTASSTVNAKIGEVTYGAFAGHNPVSVVSVGDKGHERQIQNVAAGRLEKGSTDAVNGSQLYAVANQVSTNTVNIAANATSIANLQTTVSNSINQQNSWNTEQDVQINNLKNLMNGVLTKQNGFEKELHDLRRESRAGIAGANALAIVPQAYQPGQSSIGMGVGGFKHEGAVAVGVSHISESGRWVSKAGVNYDTRRNFGAAIGLSYVFGGVAKAPAQPVVVKEVVREVVVREVPATVVPAAKKIRQ